ncbi:hypothetical protein GCK72_012351 [Caenorhabditis remanei]|uniref:Uncharacterized protein n=1 Tax=Caenorhabditis remanei TaxID=31234 RepID=A0A6A5GKQ2_CAERE|nr:hypothetical protein GCK72_012351 [Caenorhabditis remanei]KAF1755898.1 hypothetical protein GCK72_012351 [Caenorhabditis remanei]
MFSRYPKPIDLGRRTDKCYHCGALSFPRERLKIVAAKNGRFGLIQWKKIPTCIDPDVSGKVQRMSDFGKRSILHGQRQLQPSTTEGSRSAVDESQGVVTFLPSAIHPRETAKARYAKPSCTGTRQ